MSRPGYLVLLTHVGRSGRGLGGTSPWVFLLPGVFNWFSGFLYFSAGSAGFVSWASFFRRIGGWWWGKVISFVRVGVGFFFCGRLHGWGWGGYSDPIF